MTELTDREKDYREKVLEKGKWITDDFLREILVEHEKSDKIKIVEKKVSPAVGFGNNYLSTLHRVVVKFCENGTDAKQVQLIVKQFPRALVAQKMLRELGFFTNEMLMYEKVLPEMEKILRERTEDSFIAPTSYKTNMENIIIMEDLKVQEYKILDRRQLLPLDHCLLTLKSIARLQVLSLVLKKRNPGIFDQIHGNFYTEKSRAHMEPFMHQMFPALGKLFAEYPEGVKYSNLVQSFGPKGYDIMIHIMDQACNDPVQVLCHGDMWLTNIMYKEDEKSHPVHAKFVDFQISRVSSPAVDVLHLLFSSVQASVLRQHWEELINEYYDSFQENLKLFGFTKKLFSLEEFKSELKRLSPYGFMMACVMMPNVLNETDDIIDMESIPEDSFEIPDGCAYLRKVLSKDWSRTNVLGTLAQMDRLGYLDQVEKLIQQLS